MAHHETQLQVKFSSDESTATLSADELKDIKVEKSTSLHGAIYQIDVVFSSA